MIMSELRTKEGSIHHTDDLIRVATLEELKAAGKVVVRVPRKA